MWPNVNESQTSCLIDSFDMIFLALQQGLKTNACMLHILEDLGFEAQRFVTIALRCTALHPQLKLHKILTLEYGGPCARQNNPLPLHMGGASTYGPQADLLSACY